MREKAVWIPVLVVGVYVAAVFLLLRYGDWPRPRGNSMGEVLVLLGSMYIAVFVLVGYVGGRLRRFWSISFLGTLVIQAAVHGAGFLSDPENYPRSAPRGTYAEWWGLQIYVCCGLFAFVLSWATHAGTRMFMEERVIPKRHLEPRCWNCEYNLTGNTSGICPECGTTVEQSVET